MLLMSSDSCFSSSSCSLGGVDSPEFGYSNNVILVGKITGELTLDTVGDSTATIADLDALDLCASFMSLVNNTSYRVIKSRSKRRGCWS